MVRPATAPVAVPAVSDLLSIADLGPSGMSAVLSLAADIKRQPGSYARALAGKQLVLIFEKPSLRTRLTFEAGMAALGGTSFFLDSRDARIGEREPVRDVARNLERWVHGIVLRTFTHDSVTEMASCAAIPVINALTEREHPCQALADFQTLTEHCGDLRRVRLAYVGDGNNVAHSLLLASACVGSRISMATPPEYAPNAGVVAAAHEIAAHTGATIELTHDARAAVRGADAVYTDVWASMGQEHEAAARRAIFMPYQVNDELMQHAGEQALFMHCLPAHRGDEVTESVIESERSIVFEQAENRLHAQKAVLLTLLGEVPPRRIVTPAKRKR
jgi:ornithine carbamoyltransferase